MAVSLVEFTSDGGTANAIIALLVLAVLILLPVLTLRVLCKRKEDLQSEEMREQIGSLYQGLRTNSIIQLLYSTVFLVRRLLFAVVTVFMLN